MENVKKSWLQNYTLKNYKLKVILDNIREHQELCVFDPSLTNIYPKHSDILKCLTYFELYETKVVILGQDPYHNKNQATGLSFGFNGVRIPPSLRNIAKELYTDLNITLDDFTLEKWATQGVLLLNASLSVMHGKPGSHMKMWDHFTDFIINQLNNLENRVIFVAWGAFAHNKLRKINLVKHSLIISSHPSPLSTFKSYKTYGAFTGSRPFSKINARCGEDTKIAF